MRRSDFEYWRDLVWVLLIKEIRLRYKNTLLGYVWSVLNPLAFAAVFFVVFKVFVRVEMENYLLFLICGLFPWQWFQNSMVAANHHFLGNSTLIKKVSFPRQFLVLAGVLNEVFHFAASLPVIVAFLLYYGLAPSWQWIFEIPLMVLLQFAFSYGLALTVATCNLFFRDLERLVGIFTMLWLYLTPVLYSVDMIPARYHWCLYINPMAMLIENWRGVLMRGELAAVPCLVTAGYGLLALWLGQSVYRAKERRFAEIV